MSLTPEQRRARARLGGLATRARYSGAQMLRAANAGRYAKWEAEVLAAANANGEALSPAELGARTKAREALHCAQMRWAQSQRRRRKEPPVAATSAPRARDAFCPDCYAPLPRAVALAYDTLYGPFQITLRDLARPLEKEVQRPNAHDPLAKLGAAVRDLTGCDPEALIAAAAHRSLRCQP